MRLDEVVGLGKRGNWSMDVLGLLNNPLGYRFINLGYSMLQLIHTSKCPHRNGASTKV